MVRWLVGIVLWLAVSVGVAAEPVGVAAGHWPTGWITNEHGVVTLATATLPLGPIASDLWVDGIDPQLLGLPAVPPVVVEGEHNRLRMYTDLALANFFTLWAEIIQRRDGTRMEVSGPDGSSTMVALVNLPSLVAGMTRLPNQREAALFSAQHPNERLVAFPVAIDALAVVVNEQNPVTQLALSQLEAMYASSPPVTWDQFGWEHHHPVVAHSRSQRSGNYALFSQVALNRQLVHDQNHHHVRTADLMQAVADDPLAIGFGGLAYARQAPGVRAVPVLVAPDADPVAPSVEAVVAGRYPLGRWYYVVIRCPDSGRLARPVTELLRFIYTHQGQAQVALDGHLTVPAVVAERCLAMIDQLDPR